MADEVTRTADAEPAKPATDSQPVVESKEKTVGEILHEPKEPKLVPEAALITEKKARKEAEKKLKELTDSGAAPREIAETAKELATKYDVDENFIQDIFDTADKRAKAQVEADMQPIKAKEQAAETDRKFNEVFDNTLSDLPEFRDIAKRETVKALSLDPANANKTFRQILEENFGHLVKGKRTAEPTRPRDGKNDTVTVDKQRAARDPEYFKEVMADPAMKKEYNEDMGKRLHL